MPRPERQVLVCVNSRPPGNPKGSCGQKDAQALYDALRDIVHEKGLQDRIMVNRTMCLKHCSQGRVVAVQPDNVWYAKVTADDWPRSAARISRRESPWSDSPCPTSPGSKAPARSSRTGGSRV